MKFFKASIVAATMSVAAGGAVAAPLTYLGNDAISGKNVFVGSTPGAEENNGYAASFKMRDATNALGLGSVAGASFDFIAFCVDLAGTVASDDYVVNNAAPFNPARILEAGQVAAINKLYDAAYASVDTSDVVQAAGFQLALWEAAYETDYANPLSLTTGTRFGKSTDTGSAIAAKATEYLDLMQGTVTDMFTVNFLDAANLGTQDLVMAVRNPVDNPPPVPLPGAAIMLLGGLGALGTLRRRKTKTA